MFSLLGPGYRDCIWKWSGLWDGEEDEFVGTLTLAGRGGLYVLFRTDVTNSVNTQRHLVNRKKEWPRGTSFNLRLQATIKDQADTPPPHPHPTPRARGWARRGPPCPRSVPKSQRKVVTKLLFENGFMQKEHISG